MTRKDIKEYALLFLYIGTFLGVVGGVVYDVISNRKMERKETKSLKDTKQKIQSYIEFNNEKQK